MILVHVLIGMLVGFGLVAMNGPEKIWTSLGCFSVLALLYALVLLKRAG